LPVVGSLTTPCLGTKHEGITEAGATASWTAAGTSYATHAEPMIPIYIFYSMFGFQRTGDGLWAAADQMTRGFLLGATAGRTTLNGEGLQHQDGYSLLLAATNPACVAYDAAFAFELAMQWALQAQQLLRDHWGVAADVWSVTSWTELRREALAADAWNLTHPGQPRKIPYVTSRLTSAPGPVIADSDWMRAVPDQIAPFVPGRWSSLGTDGFGHSDTRGALRRHFHVDAPSIVLRVLTQLADGGDIDETARHKAITRYRLNEIAPAPGDTERADE
jgi:pyruvate dehydrogenase complex dehydrogenase (E1) component